MISVAWKEPVLSFFKVMMFFNFDIEVIRPGCIATLDPFSKYAGRVLFIFAVLAMTVFRGILLALALVTSAAISHRRPDPVPFLKSMAYNLNLEPDSPGAVTMEENVGKVFPLKYRAEKLMAPQVTSALKSQDALTMATAYEKLQLMMSRSWAVKEMYPSFDAFWASLPGQTEVTVEDFKDKWQGFGLPRISASKVLKMPSADVELSVAKEIDADGTGTISKENLEQIRNMISAPQDMSTIVDMISMVDTDEICFSDPDGEGSSEENDM